MHILQYQIRYLLLGKCHYLKGMAMIPGHSHTQKS